MKEINEMTIGDARGELESAKKRYIELSKLFNQEINFSKDVIDGDKEVDHGCCVVILDKGFIYIGTLITDGEYLVIKHPKNIRNYTSGKGLLWHAKNGSEGMELDSYDGIIKAPYNELKHFIPTDKSLWYDN